MLFFSYWLYWRWLLSPAAQAQPIMASAIATVLTGGGLTINTAITTITAHHHRLSPGRLENPVHPIDPNRREANQNQGPGGENQKAPKAFHLIIELHSSADQFAGGIWARSHRWVQGLPSPGSLHRQLHMF